MQTAETPSEPRLHDAPPPSGRGRWLVQGAFFAGFLAYVHFVIRPRLIYDAFGIYLPYPEFSLDRACLREALSRAGGFLEYGSGFLSQWFFAPLVGALMITATAGLICLGTNRLMRDMGETRGWMAGLLPAFAVLFVYRTYHHPLAALLGLAICLGLAAAYQAMAGRAAAGKLLACWRGLVFLAMCFGLYCLAGTVCVLFGLLVGTWYAGAKRRAIAGAGAMIVGALTPGLVGARLLLMTAKEAYCVAWPFGPGSTSDMEPRPLNVLRGLFLFPLAMLLVAALARLLSRLWQGPFRRFPRIGGWSLRVTAALVVLAAASAATHRFSYSPHREKRLEMVHFTLQRQWHEVLRAARQLPPSHADCFYRHLVNRALYHTGRLGDELFSFSQDQAGLLLLAGDVPHGAPRFWMLSEIAWELGDVNCAEQWAFERLEAVGECPSALELLALVCLAKDPAQGPPAAPESASSGRRAARVLLNRMTNNVIQGHRARALLALLDGTAPADADPLPEIERVRALRCRDDRVFQTYSEELMLESLLQANPRNKMAFEYLMAFYLLSRRPDKLARNLHRLEDFGYREIPRHYEEAIVIHANQTGDRAALRGRRIRPETIQRLQRFIEQVRPWQDQPRLAAAAMADEFGDSYFYYYAFGVSGTGGSR